MERVDGPGYYRWTETRVVAKRAGGLINLTTGEVRVSSVTAADANGNFPGSQPPANGTDH